MGALKLQDRFNFFVDDVTFKKSFDSEGKEAVIVEGIASTEAEDADKETLSPTGFNLKPFIEEGLVNYNHQGAKDSNANVGIPLEAKIVNGKMHVKCLLWPCPQTDGILRMEENFRKYAPNRKMGFSIEGNATQRASDDKKHPLYKKILKADITGLAITPSPKNKNTIMNIVKGEYSEAYIEPDTEEDEDETKKAITTGAIAPATPESVEHDPKKISNKFGDIINKSEIYIQIAKRYPTFSIAEMKKAYEFVGEVNSKYFKMEVNKVSADALQKAFDLLGEATAIVKGEKSEQITGNDPLEKGGDPEKPSDEDIEKAMGAANMLVKAGKSKDEACDTLVKGCGISLAVAQASWEKAVSAMQAQQNGGEPESVAVPVMKGEEISALITEAVAPINTEVSGVKDSILKGFEGLQTMYKSVLESNQELSDRLNRIEKGAAPRKSATSVAAIDRFEKGQTANVPAGDNVFNISTKEGLSNLSDKLFAENEIIKSKTGKNDDLCEGVIMSIEAQGNVPQKAYAALRQRGIVLVGNQ